MGVDAARMKVNGPIAPCNGTGSFKSSPVCMHVRVSLSDIPWDVPKTAQRGNITEEQRVALE